MKASIAWALLLCGVATGPALAQGEGCKPIPGAEQLFKRPELQWLIVGELHGTVEIPEAFGDLVCLAAAARGKAVTVGVEFPPEEQQRLDAYMATSGDPAARKALTDSPVWTGMRDGRSSEAMLALVERMRVMKARGSVARLLAIRKQPAYGPGVPYDAAKAEAMIGEGMRDAATPGDLTLILIGNIHAAVRTFGNLKYAPAAASLPSDRTVTLNAGFDVGAAWNCILLDPGATQPTCGARASGIARPGVARGIVLDNDPRLPWTGRLELGTAISASPPAVPMAAGLAVGPRR